MPLLPAVPSLAWRGGAVAWKLASESSCGTPAQLGEAAWGGTGTSLLMLERGQAAEGLLWRQGVGSKAGAVRRNLLAAAAFQLRAPQAPRARGMLRWKSAGTLCPAALDATHVARPPSVQAWESRSVRGN